MIISTTFDVPEGKIKKNLGIVKGNTVRSRNIIMDIGAALKNVVGGEIGLYTNMLTESREEAQKRMIEEAKKLGADAIIGVRFTTSSIMNNASEILAYGTAVKLSK